MGGNPFYSNAEAYAYEILQQKLIKEAQRTAQQTAMEHSALRSLFNQGQFIYCIPFGGSGLLGQNIPFSPCPPHPNYYPLDTDCIHSNPPYLQSPPPPPPPSAQPPPPTQNMSSCSPVNPPSPSSHNHLVPQSHPSNNLQSTVHVNVKSQPKLRIMKPGSDECILGKEGIDVTIDLREYIPADIVLNVEEKSVEIKACHVNAAGSKTFARRYDLPACIILDSFKCVLSHDGYLMFSAAWMRME